MKVLKRSGTSRAASVSEERRANIGEMVSIGSRLDVGLVVREPRTEDSPGL